MSGEGGPPEAANTITIDDSSLDEPRCRFGYQRGGVTYLAMVDALWLR
jgi:hypothetical protein